MIVRICVSIYGCTYMDVYVCPYMVVHIWTPLYDCSYMNTPTCPYMVVHIWKPLYEYSIYTKNEKLFDLINQKIIAILTGEIPKRTPSPLFGTPSVLGRQHCQFHFQ